MQEIRCPNCGKVFQVDAAGYAQILQQVRDKEFEKELERREKELVQRKEGDLLIARMKQEKSHAEELLKIENELAEKDRLIEHLKAQLDKADTEKKLAVSEAIQEKNRELSEKGTEITKLQSDLDLQKKEGELREHNLTEKHKGELKLRDEEIERLKDFKARQSTKMVGESLEQHCMTQFNQIRMTAFPNAYFEKDNDIRSGSKGDFIFRESSEGTEFISIMFEMKNEMDTTATKHKNEDFFKELDRDRNEKRCEYAVLVTLLESDNELYNNGIVDVSYRYPKMFVIRPQFFIPIISLLRNAALNSLEYQKKLTEVQNQQLDLYHFEENLSLFKSSFADSFRKANDRFNDAIKGIDNTISALTKIRENLVKSENHLNTANNKLEDVSIKRLTKNAPSVRSMFEERRQDGPIT
ncbi:MAG: DUF2130 domain-containing protein [Lachnospiraceae bacterium]|nr:DUF2130 domain-containing protein [Lachnospiraceae bacterium]